MYPVIPVILVRSSSLPLLPPYSRYTVRSSSLPIR